MISIIIPVLNEEQALPGTLDHARHQRGDFEVIVVDGGSSDTTCDLVKQHPQVLLLHAEKGRANQMNVGAMEAKGDWLLFLHADTHLPDDALIAIDGLPHHTGAGCFLHRFTGGHWFLSVISRLHNWRFRMTNIIYGDQAMFVRREWFHELGGFPCEAILEDVYFSERLIQQTKPIQLDKTVISDARKFLERGVWRSFFEVVLIQLHCRFKLPLLVRGFFSPVR